MSCDEPKEVMTVSHRIQEKQALREARLRAEEEDRRTQARQRLARRGGYAAIAVIAVVLVTVAVALGGNSGSAPAVQMGGAGASASASAGAGAGAVGASAPAF
jgi:hypothetical protein